MIEGGLCNEKIIVDVVCVFVFVLGGGHAVVGMTDQTVMAAVANLKIYPKTKGIILPAGLKNYFVIRTGKEQAFLIIPHYNKTRMTVKKAADGKKEGSLKGDMEGRSLVLFCNKGDAAIDMLVRSSYGIQLVNFTPEAEELQAGKRTARSHDPVRAAATFFERRYGSNPS